MDVESTPAQEKQGARRLSAKKMLGTPPLNSSEKKPSKRFLKKSASATRLEYDGHDFATVEVSPAQNTAPSQSDTSSKQATTAASPVQPQQANGTNSRKKSIGRNSSLPSFAEIAKPNLRSNDAEESNGVARGGQSSGDPEASPNFERSPFFGRHYSSNSSRGSLRFGNPNRASWTAASWTAGRSAGARDNSTKGAAEQRSSSFGGAVGDAVIRSSTLFKRHGDSFAAARAASSGVVAGGDSSFLYTSGVRLDPLLLVHKLPISMSGRVWIRRAPRLVSSWRPFWAEIRGSILLLYDADMGELASENGAQGDGLLRGSGAPVLALCSLTGALVSSKTEKTNRHSASSTSPHGRTPVRERFFVLSKQTGTHQSAPFSSASRSVVALELRAVSRERSDKWELALTAAASMRRVGIHDFKQVGALGQGASGKVFAVRDRSTGEYLAMKVIKKDQVFNSALEFRSYADERVLLQLVHGFPFAVRLRYCFQTERRLYIITELAEGGDLATLLRKQGGLGAALPEATVQRLIAEIALALEFLHSRGFVYRDLKPENVLLGADGHVQLADFGLCKQLAGGREFGLTRSLCGTHAFAAPEMLSQLEAYGMSVDAWAVGVLLFSLLRGELPYEGGTSEEVLESIHTTTLRFHESCSSAAVDLVRHLLDRNPRTRIGCDHAGLLCVLRRHAFFQSVNWDGILAREEHPDNLKPFTDDEHQLRFRPRRRRESLEQRIERVSIEMAAQAPNFPMKELDHVKPEPDENDDAYSDTSLWPLLVLGRDRIPDYVIVGNFYSKPREATRCLV